MFDQISENTGGFEHTEAARPAEKVWELVPKTATLGKLFAGETRFWNIDCVVRYCYENQHLIELEGSICFALGDGEFCTVGFNTAGNLHLKDKRDGINGSTVIKVSRGVQNFLVRLR